MKQFSSRTLLPVCAGMLIAACFSFPFSCTKRDSSSQEKNASFMVDLTSVKPGMLLTLTASEKLQTDTCSVMLGNKLVKLVKVDSVHYAFIVPVLAPGRYTLDLSKLHATNTPEIVIDSYTAIENTEQTISTAVDDYIKVVDELDKTNVGENNINFMHQLAEQIAQNVSKFSSAEKELIAYQLQQMQVQLEQIRTIKNTTQSDVAFNTTIVNSNTATLDETDEPDVELQAKIAIASTVNNAAKATLTLTKFAAVAAVLVSSPQTGTAFLILAGTAAYLKGKAASLNAEISHKESIASNIVPVSIGSSAANPMELSSGQSAWQKLKGIFRTIKTEDKGELTNDINEFIIDNELIEQNDHIIKTKFETLKNLVKEWFSSISISYEAYVSPVLTTAKEKTLDLKNKFITIESVSNSDISVSLTDDGTNGVKIAATNPKQNITSDQPFSCNVTYTQAGIKHKVSITLYCVYKGMPEKPVLTTAAVISVTDRSAVSGGNITSEGVSAVTSRGICWSKNINPTIADNKTTDGKGPGNFVSQLSGLSPSTTYHVRSYATNEKGTSYGNDLSFATASVNTSFIKTAGVTSITDHEAVMGVRIADKPTDLNVNFMGYFYDTKSITKERVVAGQSFFGETVNVPLAQTQASLSKTANGLLANTTYYVRGFMGLDSDGTHESYIFGNEVSFTTLPADSRLFGTWLIYKDSVFFQKEQTSRVENLSITVLFNDKGQCKRSTDPDYISSYLWSIKGEDFIFHMLSGDNKKLIKLTTSEFQYNYLDQWGNKYYVFARKLNNDY